MTSFKSFGIYQNQIFLGGTYEENSNIGSIVLKTSLFFNNTEIDFLTIDSVGYEFEIEGTYSFSKFGSDAGIDVENSVLNTVVTASSSVEFSLVNGTDNFTWISTYANLYDYKEDIFVFEDNDIYTFRTPKLVC